MKLSNRVLAISAPFNAPGFIENIPVSSFDELTFPELPWPMEHLNYMPDGERQEFRDAITRHIDAHNKSK